jgi:hypothetical protein
MKINKFRWLAFAITVLLLFPSTLLQAETASGSSGGENAFSYVLLFCTVITGICLLGICLVAFLKKE